MNKYFVFAWERFEEQLRTGATRPNRVPVTHFGRNCYSSAKECYRANESWVCKHLGERFKIVVFAKKPIVDENGFITGYVEPEPQAKDYLVLFRNPLDFVDEDDLVWYSDEELCNMCIGARKYDTAAEALMALAETPALKSEVTTEDDAETLADEYRAELIAWIKLIRNNPTIPF